jgi:hypothetical protein
VTSIIDGLKRLYIQKLKPLEVTYRFNDFVSPLLVSKLPSLEMTGYYRFSVTFLYLVTLLLCFKYTIDIFIDCNTLLTVDK